MTSLTCSSGFDLKAVFQNMNTNVTKPGSYQDQAAGYYSGGGLSMRMKRSSFRPVSLAPPSIKMGCNGLDMTFGSFSFISGDQVVLLAKQIATQAASYAFQLGIKTFAPQIENLMKEMRDLAMELNQFSVEDCHAVQSAFASLLPTGSAMRDMACKDVAQQGKGRDYFGARESCDKESERKAAATKLAKDKPEILIDDFNLFIKAANKVGIPTELREGMMSMVGTIVMKEGIAKPYPALARDQDTWNAHIKGGTGSVYKCAGGLSSHPACLDIPPASETEITAENSYQGQTNKVLAKLKDKFKRNEALDTTDIQFLTSMGTQFPLYHYIVLEQITGVSLLEGTSELVATHMLLEHLNKITLELQRALGDIEGKQMDSTLVKEYRTSLWKLQEYANKKWRGMIDQAERINRTALTLEKTMATRGR